ncbi:hypothetical protein GCM10022266_24320 [Agrococcus terreus]
MVSSVPRRPSRPQRAAEAKRKLEDQVARAERELRAEKAATNARKKLNELCGRASNVESGRTQTARWRTMTLDNENAVAKAIGAETLDNLTDAQVVALAEHLSEATPELQLHLIKTNPQLQAYALRAVTAVEDDLRTTLSAINENSKQAFEALGETRDIIAGELNKPDLSDDRWRYLIDKLTDNEDKAKAVAEETNQLIAEQSNAARGAKLAIAAMPYVEVVLQVGIRLLISRGRL